MNNRVSSGRLTALSLALAAALPALAQTSAAPQLKETVVTANRVQQDVQSAPFSAVVLTGDQILASGATDANEAIRRLVGIPSRTDLRGGRNYSLDLMGYGATADQNVVVIVDGVRISENEQATARLSAISSDMIESIEIIRGGSSVQWGEGASAGLIHVVLKKNVAAGVRGSASLQGESLGGRDVRAQLLGGNGTVGFDLNVRDYKTDGFRDNSKNTQKTLSAGVNGTVGGLGFRARVSSEDEKSRFPGPLTFAQYSANQRQTLTPNDYGNFTETRVSAGIDYKLDAFAFALDIAHRNRASDSFYAAFGGFSSAGQSKVTQISPKVTYSSRVGTSALTVVAGLDLTDWNYHSVTTYGNESARQTNNASYLTGDLLLPTGTRLTAGSRHESVNKRAVDLVAFPPVNYDRNDGLTAWDFGVNQVLATGLNVYGRSAKAYRLPNVDENRYLTMALRPQTSRDLEVGLKWNLVPGHNVGVRAFRQKATDEIAFDPATFNNVNLDPTRRQGLELNGKTAITRDLSLSGSVQSITAKFSGGPNTGQEIPLVSQMSAALRMDWQLDARQRIGVGVQYLGEARFGNDNANTCGNKIPSSTLLDARYAVKLDKVELSVAADNLANNKGYSLAYDCVNGGLYPNPGRVIKLAAKYSF